MKSPLFSQIVLFHLVLVAIASKSIGQSTLGSSQKSEFIESTLPAVVKVDTPLGHGTGFFISNDGWVVTNHHVIANAPIDPNTGYQFCRLSLANLNKESEVEMAGREVWATVYKVDKRADLALLKADELPSGLARSPFLSLSDKQGKLGEDCFAIGMPAKGVDWAVRKGVVSGHGIYPDDFELGSAKLSSSATAKVTPDFNKTGSYQATITTCGINKGDSGGPVFNLKGEVIAVTVAIPTIEGNVNYDKFSYHIHLSELKDFIKELPKAPEITPPSIKPLVSNYWQEIDQKNLTKTIKLVNPIDGQVVFMMDVDAKGPSLETEAIKKTIQLPEQSLWKKMSIDWAFVKSQKGPTCYFFDLNQDGNFEQVFVAPIDDGASATQYTLKDGKWIFSTASDDFLDRLQFESSDVQNAFARSRQGLAPKIKR